MFFQLFARVIVVFDKEGFGELGVVLRGIFGGDALGFRLSRRQGEKDQAP